MIYTFYSYKGGVGRTMAVANIAELFYQAGLKVLMVDWDLEAPGLERFFPSIGLEETLDKPGLIDMLLRYKEKMAQEVDEDASLEFESPKQYIINVYPEQPGPSELLLLTAGRRSKLHFADYARAVLTFDWQDFYKAWGGELYFNWLREQFESLADVVLIDSRTGVTEMGGVCTYQLADTVVMFCAPNQQSLDGTYEMAQNLTDQETQTLRRGRPLDILIVPARVERAEGELLDRFQEEFVGLFKDFAPWTKGIDIQKLWELGIPYIPKYAFTEAVAVRESGRASAEDMAAAFGELRRVMWHLMLSRLAYEQPNEAARRLALAFSRVDPEDKSELTQMTSLVERFAEPLADFEPLLAYARGMASLARNDRKGAITQFDKVFEPERREVSVGGVRLPIPQEIVQELATPPKKKDWNRLQRYLPADKYQTIQDAILDKREDVCAMMCIDHLNQLLRAVVTYLPRHLALELLQEPVVAQNKGQFLEGTLLFADISDLTAMSEKLCDKGEQEGAEEIVRVINEYLDVMLAILYKYNGCLVKFGGDTMLCLFTGADQGAMNAVWAAWEMKQAMADHFAKVEMLQEIYPLEMKAGSNSGLLFAANVGTVEHMEYVLTGSAVERAARAESAAHRGEILISDKTYKLAKDKLKAEGLVERPDFYRVIDIRSAPVFETKDLWSEIEEYLSIIEDDLWEVVDRLDALSPYLPAGVLPQLVYDPQEGQIEGQHRQVTVLFANFMGMSEIIRARGVEDEAGIATDLSEYFKAMQEEIQYYDGVINKVDLFDQEDKLMAMFGAPIAHERDTQHAALAALAMQEAMGRLSSPAAAALLSQRIGVHTGFVFAGNVGSSEHNRREYTVMGNTVNLAARLMSAAQPDQVWVSERLWNQIHDGFKATALPPAKVKGISEPIAAYHLQGTRSVQGKIRSRVLDSEMVGREDEMEALETCFYDLFAGGWKQIVTITGPAGVGKTRLVEEWQRRISESADRRVGGAAATWLSARGRFYGQKTHGVFIEILEGLLAFADDDSQDEHWHKLSTRVRETFADVEPGYFREFSNRLAYLARFLALDLSKRQGLTERMAGLEAETLQIQTRLAICDLLAHAAEERPLILVLEDLHWADEASLDILKFILDRMSNDTPILFCLIFRPQKEQPIWQTWQYTERSYPNSHLISLQELEDADARQLLFNLLKTTHLPENFQALVLDAANGNPLYVEEILHALIEDGTIARGEEGWQIIPGVEHIRVPNTLYQIIQSRIDELDFGSPGARRVLWMAAVIGEEFAHDLLQDLFISTGRQKEEFWMHLRELRNADMIQRIRIKEVAAPPSRSPQRRYRFRHGLVQQVAYENMLVAKRCEYHGEIGHWLEKQYSEDLPRYYHTLAYHYDQGQQWEKAFQYHWLAGQRNAQAYANQSAISHLQRALEIAGYEAQDARALGQVHFELGNVFVVMGEFDDALRHLTRAWDLLGDTPGQAAVLHRARVSYEIGRVHMRKGSLKTAREWQDKGLKLLPEAPTAEAALLHLLGATADIRQADLGQVERECEQALRLAEATGAKAELGLAHRLSSYAARGQGRFDSAMEHLKASIGVWQELSNKVQLAKDRMNLGILAFETGDWPLAQASYLEALKTQERIGDRFQLAMTCGNLGDLYCHLGDFEEGLAYARRGLEIFKELEAYPGIVFAHTVLATLFWRQGDLEQARTELLEACRLIKEQKAPGFEATVGRWLAQVYLTEGDVTQAEAETRALRALTAEELSVEAEPVQRLWGQVLATQGKLAEAQQVLQDSLARLEQRREPYQTGCTLLALARVLAQMEGRAGEARAHAERAREIFADLGARLDLQEAEELITELGE